MMNKYAIQEIDPTSFSFLSKPVGSGKTRAAIKYISLNDNESHIFVSPTNDLAKEISARMEKGMRQSRLNGKIKLLNTDNLKSGRDRLGVAESILNEISSLPATDNHILIITTAAFRLILPRLSYWEKSRYNVFLDEGIDPIEYYEANVGILAQKFHNLIEIDGNGKFVIKEGSKKSVERIALGKDSELKTDGDLCHVKLVKIAKMLNGDIYDVYGTIGDKDVRAVGLVSPKEFCKFKSVTIIVALFNQSLLAKYWEYVYNVKFKEFRCGSGLRDTHKEKGPLISIHYLLHKRDNASRTSLDYNYNGKPIFDLVTETVASFFGNKTFCYSANKNQTKLDKIFPNGIRMPIRCAGLNTWQNESNVVVLSTNLPKPWVGNIIKKVLGDSGETFYQDWRFASTYQTVGRCSIRVEANDEKINVVVLSYEEAKALNDLFKGSTLVGQIGSLGSIKRHKKDGIEYSPADHRAYYKFKKTQAANDNEALSKTEWFHKIRKPNIKKHDEMKKG